MNPPCNEWVSAFFDGIMADEAAVAAADNTIPYQDFSTYIEDGGRLEKHKKSERNFPARLHAMLSDEQHSHIISWMPHGRAWKVLDKKLLVEEAIPKYFGQTKYASFTRQLSGWGFRRLHQTGLDFGCYYHECFLQGQPRLTILMRRVPSGQGNKATRNITRPEPDFYVIAEQFPLHDTGEEPVYSPTLFEDKKKEEEEYETKAKELNAFHEVMTSFVPLPVSNHDNLDSIASSWASTSRCDNTVNQFHVKNGNQYFGKTSQDETGSEHNIMYTPAPVFSPHYLGATGNLYQNVQDQGGQGLAQPPQTAMVAAPIGICATDSASWHGSAVMAVGHPDQHQHTHPHFQGVYHDPLVCNNRGSLGYVSMNLDSQLQSNNDYQHYHPKGQDQKPTHRSTHNPWIATAVTEDPLKQMPMRSIPDQAFDFNSSSLEDSFCNSPVDPTTTTTFLE